MTTKGSENDARGTGNEDGELKKPREMEAPLSLGCGSRSFLTGRFSPPPLTRPHLRPRLLEMALAILTFKSNSETEDANLSGRS